jgi:hypothetical protein
MQRGKTSFARSYFYPEGDPSFKAGIGGIVLTVKKLELLLQK